MKQYRIYTQHNVLIDDFSDIYSALNAVIDYEKEDEENGLKEDNFYVTYRFNSEHNIWEKI